MSRPAYGIQPVVRSVATVLIAAQVGTAAPVIDQSHIINQSVGGLIIDEGFSPAQTFNVGTAGLLSQIDVQIAREVGDIGELSLELWSVTSGGPSGAAPLFTVPIDPASVPVGNPSASLPYLEVDVTSGALNVTSGEQYAVALSGTAAIDAPHAFWNSGRPGYAGGDQFYRAGSWVDMLSEFDFGFRTWVDPAQTVLEQLDFAVLVDAEAHLFESGVAAVNFNGNSIAVDQESSNGADVRGVFEFDVSALPQGARIEAARFTFDIDLYTSSTNSYPVVELYGFQGDGEASAANARDLSTLLGSTGDITSLDTTSVALDVAAVRSLLDNSSILGLIAFQAGPPQWLTIVSSEYAAIFPSTFTAPTLTIEYSIPPAADLPPGDYNGDAYVNAADYVVWRNAQGTSGESPADGDGDGMVDQNDFVIWRGGYGTQPDAQVPNGDFATGDLSEWDVVIEPNTDVSFGFPRVESFDVDGDGQATNAMRVRLGRLDTSLDGGVVAIERQLLLAEGDYEFSADIASQSLQPDGNTGPGNFALVLDGQVLDQALLNGTLIGGFEVLRNKLQATLRDVQAGYHTLRLEVQRGATNSREIYQFFDNISLTRLAPASAHHVPEPGTMLLALGMFVLAGDGRQRSSVRKKHEDSSRLIREF